MLLNALDWKQKKPPNMSIFQSLPKMRIILARWHLLTVCLGLTVLLSVKAAFSQVEKDCLLLQHQVPFHRHLLRMPLLLLFLKWRQKQFQTRSEHLWPNLVCQLKT